MHIDYNCSSSRISGYFFRDKLYQMRKYSLLLKDNSHVREYILVDD